MLFAGPRPTIGVPTRTRNWPSPACCAGDFKQENIAKQHTTTRKRSLLVKIKPFHTKFIAAMIFINPFASKSCASRFIPHRIHIPEAQSLILASMPLDSQSSVLVE
jgi:hypothetical protein